MSAIKYVILEASELPIVDFNEVMETSAETLRYSLDASKFLVKYRGNKPRWLYGETTYTNLEISEILSSSDWSRPEE